MSKCLHYFCGAIRRVGLAMTCAVSTFTHAQTAPTYADVAPLFAQRCVVCHSGEQAAAKLRLDAHASVLAGGGRGPVVKPGNAAGSELIRRVKGQSQPRMPMTGPPWLGDAEVALLERWIDAGAQPAPSGGAAQASASPAAVLAPGPGEPVTWVHVAPVFAQRCAKCHTDGGQMGAPPEGFRLTSYASALDAADRARIVPGQPEASELLRRIRGQALPRMPMDGPPYLSANEIGLVQRWIEQGARGADGKAAAVPVGANVRLHGTFRSGSRLDDLALIVGPGARLDKAPALGQRAEVRGRLDAQVQVIVERIRAR